MLPLLITCLAFSTLGWVESKNFSTREVMVFTDSTDPSVYGKFDYSVLTRVIWPYGNEDFTNFQKFRKLAQSKGVRVGRMRAYGCDDINVDFEGPIRTGSVERKNFVQAVKFIKQITNREVSVDVAWSPAGIDGRFYDVKAMEPYVDLFFVMAYDERSQIKRGPCVAGPNSNYLLTRKGIRKYLAMGIPANKIILGLPWYGRDYPCRKYDKFSDTCGIEKIPFRGVNCSDSPGIEKGIGEIQRILNETRAKVKWHQFSGTPYFTYKDSNGSYHQVWFDDIRSLRLKLDLVTEFGLRGAGVWNAVLLDNSDTPAARKMRRQYWGLFKDFKNNSTIPAK